MTSQLKVDRISPATGSEIIIDGFGGGAIASVQTFTSSGTWTKPSGITKVMVEVQGGGGSGNKSDNTAKQYATGGAGGYAKKLIDVSSISTATITVGSGGSGITTTVTGNSGGSSIWYDGTNTVTGGGGGASTATGSSGGTASGGDLNINGAGTGTQASGGLTGTVSFLGACSERFNFMGYGYGSSAVNAAMSPSLDGGDGIVIVTEYK